MTKDEAIEEARLECHDDLVFGDDPEVDETDDGFWVQAWVHVRKPDWLLEVHEVADLDDEHRPLHSKPWITVAPDNTVVEFDTEEEAYAAQRAAGYEP